MPGENLDVSSQQKANTGPSTNGARRKFIGVHFACCDVYTRIYIDPGATAYSGHCPKCSRPVRVRIGSGGVDCRFFTAY